MTNIRRQVQKLSTDDFVTLYELDATMLGGAVYHFTKRMRETTYISFGGVQYTAIDVDATGFTWDGKGSFPKPTLRVSNVNGVLTAAIITLKDLVGAKLTRIRTFADHLDDGSDPDGGSYLPLDIFTVEQKTRVTAAFVEWRLSSVIDALNLQLPARPILRDVCTQRYRYYDTTLGDFVTANATCPYAGTNYYDENDKKTTKANDACGKRLTSCKVRFGEKAELPTWAFPGVAKY